MSKHLTGSKRLQVIQKWLNGREDPEWDVLPCKKENKYIVKRRTEPLTQSTAEPPNEPPDEKVEPQPVEEKKEDEDIKEPEIKTVIKQKPLAMQPKQIFNDSPKEVAYSNDINFEILSELRALGQEMRLKREKKEQKKMIKEVMNKELYKRNQYTQPQYIQQPNESESESEVKEPDELYEQPHQIISRRRNNIFSDIY
ncbi:hypothetical protein M9Y10_037188 [Tritrichomonas musculus]|uniref:Uncharacterized protein n=1 Tax=Tritrichomonas musculus TaxID=1915356 RepID=A0ABR2GT58_9EUKA